MANTISYRSKKAYNKTFYYNKQYIVIEMEDVNLPDMTVYIKNFVFTYDAFSTWGKIRIYTNRNKMSKGIFAQFPCKELERTLFASRVYLHLTKDDIDQILNEVKKVIH